MESAKVKGASTLHYKKREEKEIKVPVCIVQGTKLVVGEDVTVLQLDLSSKALHGRQCEEPTCTSREVERMI